MSAHRGRKAEPGFRPSDYGAAAFARFAEAVEDGLPSVARKASEGWWAHKDSNLGPAD
jgi:hypothetical protein